MHSLRLSLRTSVPLLKDISSGKFIKNNIILIQSYCIRTCILYVFIILKWKHLTDVKWYDFIIEKNVLIMELYNIVLHRCCDKMVLKIILSSISLTKTVKPQLKAV